MAGDRSESAYSYIPCWDGNPAGWITYRGIWSLGVDTSVKSSLAARLVARLTGPARRAALSLKDDQLMPTDDDPKAGIKTLLDHLRTAVGQDEAPIRKGESMEEFFEQGKYRRKMGEPQYVDMLKTNKKARKLALGFEHMEKKRMITEDAISAALQRIEKAEANAAAMLAQAEDLALVAAAAVAASPARPAKFRPGQSVCDWWASWFKECRKAPENYGKKKRPAWFSAEVLSYVGWQTVHYAGFQVEAHCYRVY